MIRAAGLDLVGPFRYLDLMGVRAYEMVMRDLLPDLSRSKEIPQLMRQPTGGRGNGNSSARGFYKHMPAQAKRWEKRLAEYTYDVRRLTAKYSIANN